MPTTKILLRDTTIIILLNRRNQLVMMLALCLFVITVIVMVIHTLIHSICSICIVQPQNTEHISCYIMFVFLVDAPLSRRALRKYLFPAKIRLNPFTADHDYSRFYSALLAGYITVIVN